jgi:hypothetical protein
MRSNQGNNGTLSGFIRFTKRRRSTGQNARCVMPYLFWMVLPLALWDAFASPSREIEEPES